MTTLEQVYNHFCKTPSDINEHLPTLKELASDCSSVVEMGVRWVVSTWAFLKAQPESLLSIDIDHPSKYNDALNYVEQLKGRTKFEFLQADTTKIEIEECDLLFIDTWHVYDQLKKELELHGNKPKKYLIFHDTITFGEKGETEGHQGLMPAIKEFLSDNPHWSILEHHKNNNGLLVLVRA